eukprot:TRINITY_DN1722_c0_g1_i1.p2 TRINITY_DN1722_c0_g1~~TRINITY_DN1722_c0_g1_i1.p2  ORF type:complete len:104 (-),score=9.71 TRINITY_DN1722_c0_g1_i1:276-587(-)
METGEQYSLNQKEEINIQQEIQGNIKLKQQPIDNIYLIILKYLILRVKASDVENYNNEKKKELLKLTSKIIKFFKTADQLINYSLIIFCFIFFGFQFSRLFQA